MSNKVILGLLVILLIGVVSTNYLGKTDSKSGVSFSKIESGSNSVTYTLAKPNVDRALGVDPFIRDDLLSLLRDRKFEKLDNKLEALAVSFEEGNITEFDFGYTMDSFTGIEPNIEALILEWVESTGSWSSYLASSQYFVEMAWQWRGNAYGHLVPKENFKKYKEMLNRSTDFLEKAKQNNTRDVIWFSKKIELANGLNDDNEAALIQEAIETFPQSTEIYRSAIFAQQQKWGGTKRLHQRLVHDYSVLMDKEDSERGATILYYEALEAANEKDYTTAITQVKKAIEKNPNRIDYYFSLARYFNMQKRFDESILTLNTVLKYWPLSRKSLQLRAQLLVKKGDYKQAREDIELALKYSPYYRKATLEAIDVYSALNKKEQAMSMVERAKYFIQHDADGWTRLGYKARSTLKDLELAEQFYTKATQAREFDVGGHYNLATLNGRKESCQVVEHLYKYLSGCKANIGKTRHWCSSKFENWAYSAVNHLQDHQKCPEINSYDFSSLST